MARYHISDGVAKLCKAQPGRCPIVGSNPLDPNVGHFNSQDEANREVERLAKIEAHRAKVREKQERNRVLRRNPESASIQELHAQNFDNFRDVDNPVLPLNAFHGEKRVEWLTAYANYVDSDKYVRRVPEVYSLMVSEGSEDYKLSRDDYAVLEDRGIHVASGKTLKNEDAYRVESVKRLDPRVIPSGRVEAKKNYEKYGFTPSGESVDGVENVTFDAKKLGQDDIVNAYQLNEVLGNKWSDKTGGYHKCKSYVSSFDYKTGEAVIIHNS